MRDTIRNTVQEHLDEVFQITKYLYENPELGNQEVKACAALCKAFESKGFQVEQGIYNIPTAFKATYDSGKPGPVIAYCAEYDALPEVGHGCGHNLICTIALLAATALAKELPEIGGRIEVFGTPAEETNGAKVEMVAQNAFAHASVVMMAHACAVSEASGTSMCLVPKQFRYYGKSAHASACPEEGISALDGVIQLFNGINALRQFMPRDVQFHGIISHGGAAANIVPDFAEAQFYVRAAKKATADMATEKMLKIAEGAAMMTGTRVEVSDFEATYYDLCTNQALCKAFVENQKSMGEVVMPAGGSGSLDLGNVSHQAPCVHGWFGFGDPGLVMHSKEFADRTVTEDGRQLLYRAACTLALTGYDVIVDPNLLKEVRLEFEAL